MQPESLFAIILWYTSSKTIDLRITVQGCHIHSVLFLFLKSHKSKQDYDRWLVLCWRESAVTVSCSDLTLLRLLWLNFRPNPVCYQCSGTMSGCLHSRSGVSENSFFFLRVWSKRRGVEWALQLYLPGCLSLPLSLCLYTVCQDPINSHSSRGERRRSAATLEEPGSTNWWKHGKYRKHTTGKAHFFSRVKRDSCDFCPSGTWNTVKHS